MFPMQQMPNEFLELVRGQITHFNFENNILSIQLHLSDTTHEVTTDIFNFNLSNEYEYRALMASIGKICWKNKAIDFRALLGKDVMIVLRHGNGYHGTYLNPICLLLLDNLYPFTYSGGVN